MTTKKLLKVTIFTIAASLTNGAFAYTDDNDKPICKTPKFRDFNLPVYSAENKTEVAPESELVFTISNWIAPDTIRVTAKDIPLELDVENKNSFFRVSAKLPASLNGKFARINARADAVLGCKGAEGWLIKIADSPQILASEPEEADENVGKATGQAVDKVEEEKAEVVIEKAGE
ncbi:hypothetical protein [Methylotuvimicrobium buryatense]|uniref:Uncharacterized protein n=1 Tax=Methylotuvimicrobium buryatense TaxID=95641 RepID=A0A4P9UTJ1_METBY|nr:hypothetical protein [Methylotuvimicrobium buryatense]QCW83913.1 hypothetical protein EQU24_17955 [Methylotuvimicrobium buryatense]